MCMTPSSELHIYVVILQAAIVIVVTQIHTTFPVPIWSNIITILLAFDHRILLIECSSFYNYTKQVSYVYFIWAFYNY